MQKRRNDETHCQSVDLLHLCFSERCLHTAQHQESVVGDQAIGLPPRQQGGGGGIIFMLPFTAHAMQEDFWLCAWWCHIVLHKSKCFLLTEAVAVFFNYRSFRNCTALTLRLI